MLLLCVVCLVCVGWCCLRACCGVWFVVCVCVVTELCVLFVLLCCHVLSLTAVCCLCVVVVGDGCLWFGV